MKYADKVKQEIVKQISQQPVFNERFSRLPVNGKIGKFTIPNWHQENLQANQEDKRCGLPKMKWLRLIDARSIVMLENKISPRKYQAFTN